MRPILIWGITLNLCYILIHPLHSHYFEFVALPFLIFEKAGWVLIPILLGCAFLYQWNRKKVNLTLFFITLGMTLGPLIFKPFKALFDKEKVSVIYSDGVMGSLDIEFYENTDFHYVRSCIIGDEIYRGTYSKYGYKVYLNFQNPPKKINYSQKLTFSGNKVIGDAEDQFYIESGEDWWENY